LGPIQLAVGSIWGISVKDMGMFSKTNR